MAVPPPDWLTPETLVSYARNPAVRSIVLMLMWWSWVLDKPILMAGFGLCIAYLAYEATGSLVAAHLQPRVEKVIATSGTSAVMEVFNSGYSGVFRAEIRPLVHDWNESNHPQPLPWATNRHVLASPQKRIDRDRSWKLLLAAVEAPQPHQPEHYSYLRIYTVGEDGKIVRGYGQGWPKYDQGDSCPPASFPVEVAIFTDEAGLMATRWYHLSDRIGLGVEVVELDSCPEGFAGRDPGGTSPNC